LLAGLDSDRERAALKYEEIRRRLIKRFRSRGCIEAEDLADETINRVIRRLNEIGEFTGDCEPYFYGVANKVLMEHQRRRQPQPPVANDVNSNRAEQEDRCLEECIAKLSDENRQLLLQYYQGEGRAKIEQRKQLAENLGIAPNALRIRAFRIRAALQECVEKCLERTGE
jgi:RNA polymerase sigma factor (sigma-70 family)